MPSTLSPLRGAIAAMNHDNVIGLDGDIPWHYSEDLKRFKQTTLDSTIIMGRLTWESIGSKALPRRRNIVISRSTVENVEYYNNIDTAIEQCAQDDIWFIGGGQIYQAVMPILNLLDITYVPDKIDSPNVVVFPEIDPSIWQVTSQQKLEDSELVNMIYQRRG